MKKVVFITGVSSGLGKVLATYLTSKGYLVLGGSRKKVEIKDVAWVKLDITNSRECVLAIKKVTKKIGRIDVLINNAGYTISGETIGLEEKDFVDILSTNAVGAFRLIKEIVPIMRKQKGGKIINVTSLNGLISLPNFGLYSASKHALEALGVALHYELAKDGISVTNLAPGAIDSEGEGKSLSHKPAREKFKALYYFMPMIKKIDVAKKIEKLIEEKNPPSEVIVGSDALILTLMKRFLPSFIWDYAMNFVWRKK